ncbi:MAG: DNA polymerase III subunit gamma/tau [Planctomycetota bacterium]
MNDGPENHAETSPPATAATNAAKPYVVVARRYRPQTFDDLIGQEHVADALRAAILSGRVGHAYLFTGARGVGKTSAARIFAKAINCPSAVAAPCKCELCESVSAGGDVDVLEIDGASNRGIDEIRQLRQNVAVRPSRARHKVYIIDEVHMLTKEAFNALLKTLEEPPEHVKFVFATTEPNKIPITILSRCQRFDFAGIETGSIQERLMQIAEAEGVRIDDEAVALLAMRAAGSMRDSQSLLEQLLATGGSEITSADVTSLLGLAPAARLTAIVRPLVNRDAAAALAAFDGALADGSEVGQVIDQLLAAARDALTQAVGCPPEQMLNTLPAQHAEIADIGRAWGVDTLLAVIQVLDQTTARMRLTTQARTLAEMALVRICRLEDLDAIAGLVETLKTGEPLPTAPPRPQIQPASPKPSLPKPQAEPSALESKEPPSPPPAPTEPQAVAETQSADEPQAAAAPTPPPASPGNKQSPLDTAQLPTLWQTATEQLEGLLGGFAAQAARFSVADSEVVVGFSEADAMAYDRCQEPANTERLEALLAAAAGRPIKLRFETFAPTKDDSQPETPKPRRRTDAEVAAEPMVQKAVELFNADATGLRYVPPRDKP